MKITILGSGTFFLTEKRSGPAYLLEFDGKKALIDCGPGTLARLAQVGVKPEDLDFIFITHFHADHTTDLFALQMNIRLLDAFVGNLEKKLVVYGPKGIESFTRRLSEIYQLPAFDNFDKITYEVLGDKVTIGPLGVIPYMVEHIALSQSAEALALRFEENGKVFVFSGDSNDNPGLRESCRGADVFICDTSQAKGAGNPAHLDTVTIGEVAEEGKVKKLVLSHFYPLNDGIDLASEVKEKYSGEVVYGKDLMEVEL